MSVGPEGLLRIGELAIQAGVSTDTIRLYDRRGLLPRTQRSDAGYRLFKPDVIRRVRLIRHAAAVGFSLRELSTFFGVRDRGGVPCRAVRAAGDRILERLEAQLADLAVRRRDLRSLLQRWDQQLAVTPPSRQAHLMEMLSEPPRPRRASRLGTRS